ncbi:MAG: glutathione S-transferase family protein [Alphaproteobacteria bacterium]|nr:glutathione S-transferase family protein [Alphaproteobacteria bacterium]
MGQLIDGVWKDEWYDTKASKGRFMRSDARFRNWVTADGSSGFNAEAGRYHLYVADACPWAHRALIFRHLKGLEDMISVSTVDPLMLENGWTFTGGADPIFGARFMYEVYLKADPAYSGRVTVPALWDKARQTIVSNESSEIVRMFNSAFDGVGAAPGDYYPAHLHAEIDDINARVYSDINNGVYKCGFATTQAAYEEAFDKLFATLDWLEELLSSRQYLAGEVITEADWRLFATLVRFDAVYFGHFKCNKRRLVDYPNLWAYTRELYQIPGIAETVHLDETKEHYYGSHKTINPTGIVPKGPLIDFLEPHGRA